MLFGNLLSEENNIYRFYRVTQSYVIINYQDAHLSRLFCEVQMKPGTCNILRFGCTCNLTNLANLIASQANTWKMKQEQAKNLAV